MRGSQYTRRDCTEPGSGIRDPRDLDSAFCAESERGVRESGVRNYFSQRQECGTSVKQRQKRQRLDREFCAQGAMEAVQELTSSDQLLQQFLSLHSVNVFEAQCNLQLCIELSDGSQ